MCDLLFLCSGFIFDCSEAEYSMLCYKLKEEVLDCIRVEYDEGDLMCNDRVNLC